MKTIHRASLFAIALALPLAALAQEVNVTTEAEREVLRRGNLVESIDGIDDAIAEALAPPADDSGKWYFTLITTRNCPACAAIKTAFAESAYLRPFVDVNDHRSSWAHFNAFSSNDVTQRWRWKNVHIGGYPTLIIQPPKNGRYGDASTLVWQKTGYDGNAQKLATDIRAALVRYAKAVDAKRLIAPQVRFGQAIAPVANGYGQAVEQIEQAPASDYAPPFAVPEADTFPSVNVFPPNFPSVEPHPSDNQATDNLGQLLPLLAKAVGMLTGSSTLQNLLLLVIAAFTALRHLKPKPTTLIAPPEAQASDGATVPTGRRK